MKKNAFTLAETVIALSLVGILAALTLPQVIDSHQRKLQAKTLSVAVSNFENAMNLMLLREGVDNLASTKAWKSVNNSMTRTSSSSNINKFMKELEKYMPIESYKTATVNYKNLKGSANVSYNAPVRFFTKKGIEYKITIADVQTSSANESAVMAAGGSYVSRAGYLQIDVNGEDKPNIEGRDYFDFEIASDGKIYPWRGEDHCIKNGYTKENTKTKCVTQREGHYCTAYLVENGYEMDY